MVDKERIISILKSSITDIPSIISNFLMKDSTIEILFGYYIAEKFLDMKKDLLLFYEFLFKEFSKLHTYIEFWFWNIFFQRKELEPLDPKLIFILSPFFIDDKKIGLSHLDSFEPETIAIILVLLKYGKDIFSLRTSDFFLNYVKYTHCKINEQIEETIILSGRLFKKILLFIFNNVCTLPQKDKTNHIKKICKALVNLKNESEWFIELLDNISKWIEEGTFDIRSIKNKLDL